jgi:ABC-type branched-subunit amino acid transport system ATPase component
MLTVRDLHVKRGATHILRGVDITVAPGEICVLMGASGGGKSTALRAVVALQPFDSGA